MRTVQIYINDEILDLFDDENIEVSSSIQNINDIAKVFTDFSKQFTVPASPRNNEIFKHYYQNDVEDGFIAKERQPARIEINYTPFRRGKIQLEGAELVEGEAQHYSITFYGDVVTLKDLFGDDKLRDLDYSSLSFEGTYNEVKTSLTSGSSLDVRYPLIATPRALFASHPGPIRNRAPAPGNKTLALRGEIHPFVATAKQGCPGRRMLPFQAAAPGR